MEERFSGACRCRCGAVRMRVTSRPLTRFYCHCAVCREVYRRPFGDPTVAWGFRVRIEDVSKVAFRRQRSVPFSVRCGTCRSCAEPVVGYSRVVPGLEIAYVPAGAYEDAADVPAAAGHIFHASRVADVDDELPRYEGFLASEWGVARMILAGWLRSWRRGRSRLASTGSVAGPAAAAGADGRRPSRTGGGTSRG